MTERQTDPATRANARLEDLLPDADLARFRERAARYDADNRFFAEDFARLRELGYLTAPVPVDRGGAGLGFADLVASQRRLAAAAPATALGVNMHLVWVQVARFLLDRGDERLTRVLDEAVAGEVFAFGISEAGNDAVLLDATTTATPCADGYLLSGTKIFTTLSPVWTRLGVHARVVPVDGADGAVGSGANASGDRLVFGFVRRDAGEPPAGARGPEEASLGLSAGRISHPGIWNPLGMRATQSWTTRLDAVPLEQRDVVATIAPFDPSDPLILAIFASFSVLTAAVYAGIADRALELATDAANRPEGDPGEDGAPAPTRLDDPDVAARLTQAVLAHRASLDALEVLSRDVDERRERGDWFLALAAARNLVTDEARDAVEVAMRVSGARSFQADSELARLYRDVAAGLFHPSSSRALARTVRAALTR